MKAFCPSSIDQGKNSDKKSFLEIIDYKSLHESDQQALSCIQEACPNEIYYRKSIGLDNSNLILSEQDWVYFEKHYEEISQEYSELLYDFINKENLDSQEKSAFIEQQLSEKSEHEINKIFQSKEGAQIRFLRLFSYFSRELIDLIDPEVYRNTEMYQLKKDAEKNLAEEIRPAVLNLTHFINHDFNFLSKLYYFNMIESLKIDGYLELRYPENTKSEALEKFQSLIRDQLDQLKATAKTYFSDFIPFTYTLNFLEGSFKSNTENLSALAGELTLLVLLNYLNTPEISNKIHRDINYPISSLFNVGKKRNDRKDTARILEHKRKLDKELFSFCEKAIVGSVSSALDDRFYSQERFQIELNKLKTNAKKSLKNLKGLDADNREQLEEKIEDLRIALPPSRKKTKNNITRFIEEKLKRIELNNDSFLRIKNNLSENDKVLFAILSLEETNTELSKTLKFQYKNSYIFTSCEELLPQLVEDYTHQKTKFIKASNITYKYPGALHGVLGHEIAHHIFPHLQEQNFHRCSLERYQKQYSIAIDKLPGEQYLDELFADQFGVELAEDFNNSKIEN
ncbi:MAG: hypothetical protein VX642_10105, partial [Bdellovibrionota bacterium]|nr:hypothetical protein [Bdellovibrionota bacterium]